MTLKKAFGKIHLWLGLASGLLVLFMGLTGCILAFQREIEDFTQDYRFTEQRKASALPPSQLKEIADRQYPGKKAHSITYQQGRSAMVTYYNSNPQYYCIVFLDPCTGKVLKAKNMDADFFRFIIMGHYYLWLPPGIGQPIVASGTLLFLVLLITGIVLWWPKNKAAARQRFTIKLHASWRRVNYDLHNVLGFYMAWVGIFLAITGLVMGFQWFAKSVYWVASAGKQATAYTETLSDTTRTYSAPGRPAIDLLYYKVTKEVPAFKGSIDVHIPENKKSSVEVAINPDTYTYWKADYRYYDQYTLKEIPVKHIYGKLKDASAADKLTRMNYDIHVGAIAGLPGKMLAFFGSLICASMPVTGFMIWLGRRKKAQRRTSAPVAMIKKRKFALKS